MGKSNLNFFWRRIKNHISSHKKCGRFLLRFLILFISSIFLFRFIPIPFSAYMLQQKMSHLFILDFDYNIQYDWVSLNEISPYMQLAAIAAEDQAFPKHYGFDWNAIENALKHNQKSKKNSWRLHTFTADR